MDNYSKKLIKWVKDHYWDSLEKDKDLILRHLRTFTGDYPAEPPFESFKNHVLEKEKEGTVVLMTVEGSVEVNLDDLVKQPAQGILYDLNRDKATVLTFIDDPKWVNDYAVGLVITKLKSMLGNN